MKCPSREAAWGNNMEKSSPAPTAVAPAESKVLYPQVSPLKEPPTIKPHFPPASVTTALFSLNNSNRAVHNKENSNRREHDRTLDEGLEDSGYLSLQSSQIDEHHVAEEEDQSHAATHQERITTPKHSPSKCPGKTNAVHPVCLEAPSTPVSCPERRAVKYSLSSTPASHHDDPNLPILNFQRAVCEELAKSFQRTQRYECSTII